MKNYKLLADSDLCTFLNQGDKKAYTEIYIRYFQKIFIHTLDRLKNEEEAKDMVQTIFTYLWINHSVANPSNLKAYLYAAARNAVINYINRQKHGTDYLDTLHPYLREGECVTDHLVRENMLSDMIDAEINRLPPKMRKIFLLSRKQFLSYKEIALQLDISEETVRSQMKNAIRILRVRLTLLAYIFFLLHK